MHAIKKISDEKAGPAVTDRSFVNGDWVAQPMLAHKGAHEAHVAADVIPGEWMGAIVLAIGKTIHLHPHAGRTHWPRWRTAIAPICHRHESERREPQGRGRITPGLRLKAALIKGAKVRLSSSDGSVLPCWGWRVITQAA
jgi:hypothetical protein